MSKAVGGLLGGLASLLFGKPDMPDVPEVVTPPKAPKVNAGARVVIGSSEQEDSPGELSEKRAKPSGPSVVGGFGKGMAKSVGGL